MRIRSTLTRTCTTLALALLCAPSASAQSRIATLAIVNGHVVTVDSAKPEAEAVAIAGDRILAVGTTTSAAAKLAAARSRFITLIAVAWERRSLTSSRAA